jgi:hypothetical protein
MLQSTLVLILLGLAAVGVSHLVRAAIAWLNSGSGGEPPATGLIADAHREVWR